MDNRKIDTLVAQYVMGFHIHPQFSEWLCYPIKNDEVDYFEPTIIPNYTTDIAAAWQVVEKMIEKSCMTGLKFNYFFIQSEWMVEIGKFEAINESVCLAICLAALKAVGVDYTEQRKEE